MDAARQELRMNGTRTILFVDEIHRFNKAQQDAFLPNVEEGTITLIGATTENPSFEINAALLSRCRVFLLKPLDEPARRTVGRAAKAPLLGAAGGRIGRALGDLWMDLRFALRTFRQQPTFVAVAVLTSPVESSSWPGRR